jgi:hypothetical protein
LFLNNYLGPTPFAPFASHLLQKSIPGVIITQKVVARKGNSESYKKSFKDPLHAGTEFNLLKHRGNWLQVELPDARTCWLPATDVELVR